MTMFSFGLANYKQDPYGWYRRFRAQDPVHWGAPVTPGAAGAWYLFRHDDCVSVLKDPRFSKDVPRILRETGAQLPAPYRSYIDRFRDAVLFKDPPDHTRLRQAVNKYFIAKAVQLRAEGIAAIVERLLAPLAARGEFDVIEDFAYPFPMAVICDILGTPAGDVQRVRRWTEAFIGALSGSRDPAVYERAVQGHAESRDYFAWLLKERRKEPRADLLSAFANTPPGEGRLTDGELVTMFYSLLSGGYETTANAFGNAVYHLWRHPDQLAVLRAEPAWVENAVEEFQRFETSVHYTFRFALEDVELRGKTIRRHDRVMVMLASAAHDPAVHADPDRLDVRRAVGANALQFGRGPHYCLGAALVGLELRTALGAFLRRFPRLALKDQPYEWTDNFQFRGLRRLQVRTGSARHL